MALGDVTLSMKEFEKVVSITPQTTVAVLLRARWAGLTTQT